MHKASSFRAKAIAGSKAPRPTGRTGSHHKPTDSKPGGMAQVSKGSISGNGLRTLPKSIGNKAKMSVTRWQTTG
jgi:hypothetical protein